LDACERYFYCLLLPYILAGSAEGAPSVDPRGGDAILKRMLQMKPKTHDEMIKERRKETPERGALKDQKRNG
jgi:hypothetical protein